MEKEQEKGKSPYDILSDLYEEEKTTLSNNSKPNTGNVMKSGVLKSVDLSGFKDIFDKIMIPLNRIDSFIFKAPPKMTNAYNRRGSWFK